MGSTPVGSGSVDLISNEGITTVGLLGAFFPAVLGVSLCHPLVGRSALKRGWFHILLSSLLAWTRCVASCPPLGIGLLRRPRRFHALVFHAWWLASGSSGSRTSRYRLLVYVQGASDSLPHSSPGREVVAFCFLG